MRHTILLSKLHRNRVNKQDKFLITTRHNETLASFGTAGLQICGYMLFRTPEQWNKSYLTFNRELFPSPLTALANLPRPASFRKKT